MKTKWIKITTLPLVKGRFWLYGKVWGDEAPDLYIIEVMKVSNGFMHTLKGSYLFDNDIEGECYITKLHDPELPVFK